LVVGRCGRGETRGCEPGGSGDLLPGTGRVVGEVDDHHTGGAGVGEQAGQVFGAVPGDGLSVRHDDGRPEAGGVLDRAEGAVEHVSASEGASVGGLDDRAVEERCVVGEADFEQVGSRLREPVEATAFGSRGV
jgi:hypothetical protein